MTESLTLSESQWNTVMQTVHNEAMHARVAASFLPLFGPLDGDVQSVPRNLLGYPVDDSGKTYMDVVDYDTMRLSTLSINVRIKNAQIADPELSSAMIMFRRAAEIMARIEDAIIFNGQAGTGEGPDNPEVVDQVPPVFKVSGGERTMGLIEAGMVNATKIGKPKAGFDLGQAVFKAVVEAITKIERGGYHGPFALVLGDDLFTAINTPMPNSMVLPREGMLPFLDAPLLRSSAVPKDQGVLVSLRGAPVEIVVPSDISVRHITTTENGHHIFRVKQKFVLRIKDHRAIATLHC